MFKDSRRSASVQRNAKEEHRQQHVVVLPKQRESASRGLTHLEGSCRCRDEERSGLEK